MLEDTGGSGDSFSASDFESAASAIASPETPVVETQAADASVPGAEAQAEATPAADAPAPVVDKPKGPIPFEVHSKALDNARAKAKEEALTEWRGRYGWAEKIPQPDLQRWGETANRLLSDPVKFVEDLQAELDAHATYGPQMRAQTARRLASFRQQVQATQPIAPDVQIVDAAGNVVGMTYSDKALKLRDEQLKRELLEQVKANTAPLDKMRQQVEEKERLQQIEAGVEAQLKEAATWPHFKAYEKQIGEELLKGAADLRAAYITVFTRDIFPTLASRERQAVLGHLQNKPGASSASPSGGASAGKAIPDKDKEWTQLFEERAHFLNAG